MRGASRSVWLAFGLGLWTAAAAAQPASDDGVVRFIWPDTAASAVSLAGDFNGWSPTATPLDREPGGWVTRVFLDPGIYEYKFLVDGGFAPDPGNPERTTGGNSVVRVGADGSVLPPQVQAVGDSSAAPAGGGAIAWQLRYLGFVTARRDRDLGRWDLDRPLHDVDLRIDAKLDHTADAWFLVHADNREDEAELIWDRGLLSWRPGSFTIRAFDNTGVAQFDDPASLLGRVGRYGDAFGFGRRGVHARRRIFGAPVEALYADDTEPGVNVAPATALPDLHGGAGDASVGTSSTHYATAQSDRGADTAALRARFGTDRAGLGVGLRSDRGANAGRLAELEVAQLPGDTLVATGRELRTTESWNAWSIDVRGRLGGVRLLAEFLAGTLEARAVDSAPIVDMRAAPGESFTQRELGRPEANSSGFDLDSSRKVVVQADAGRTAPGPDFWWDARPGDGRRTGPGLRYEYEEHDRTGIEAPPVLARRHTLAAGGDVFSERFAARLDLESHWFEQGSAAEFWLRRFDFWLDEDIVGIDGVTLLPDRRASFVRAHAGGAVWPSRDLRAELHWTLAQPGLAEPLRYSEGMLRFALPLAERVELRAHSRLAVYRTFEPRDPAAIARFGSGSRIQVGERDFTGTDVAQDYRAFSAHFVECVFTLSRRADIALGFGVDPWIVYETTNEYAFVGWDSFLFDRIGPLEAPPDALGHALQDAESALEHERRLGIELRLYF